MLDLYFEVNFNHSLLTQILFEIRRLYHLMHLYFQILSLDFEFDSRIIVNLLPNRVFLAPYQFIFHHIFHHLFHHHFLLSHLYLLDLFLYYLPTMASTQLFQNLFRLGFLSPCQFTHSFSSSNMRDMKIRQQLQFMALLNLACCKTNMKFLVLRCSYLVFTHLHLA